MKKRDAVEAIIMDGNKILLLKRPLTKKIAPGAWCPPSGGIELGETPSEAVIREVKEETNLDVISLELVKEFPRPQGEHYTGTFYQYRVITQDTNVVKSDEHDEFRWVDINDIDNPEYDSLWENIKSSLRTK